jgi:hypothetical protein
MKSFVYLDHQDKIKMKKSVGCDAHKYEAFTSNNY